MKDSSLSPDKRSTPWMEAEFRWNRPLRGVISFISGVLLILLVWKAAALAVGSPFLMPPPETAFQRLFAMVPEPGFWRALGATALRSLYGFAISFGSGVLVGAAAGLAAPFRRMVKPFLSVLRAVPVMSVILLGMLWFVTDLVPVFVTFLMVFPLVCANVLEGVLQIDQRLLEMGKVYRLDAWQRIRHIVLPSLIPFLFAAANAGIGMAWKVTIAAEVLCQPRNAVGTGIQYAQLNLEIAEVMAWTAAAVILSGISEFLLGLAEKLLPWRRAS